ncbi:MAG: hypothetical protein ACPGVO_06850 [Spirulinaceae cyanobacterium]
MSASRDPRFDILRSLVILNAIAIHFHLEFDLGKLVLPAYMLQGGLFSVGSFFFFTGGYMAERVYLPRFATQACRLSRRLVQKGLSILGIYLGFLVVMYAITDVALPSQFLPVLFQEQFYTEVLLTFGLLFMLIPGLLWLRSRFVGAIWLLLFGAIAIFAIYPQLPETPLWLDYLCDRQTTLYPLLTALITFFVGFLCAELDSRSQLSGQRWLQWGAIVFVTLHLLVLVSSKAYLAFILQDPLNTLFGSVTPYLAIAALGPFVQLPRLRAILCWPPFLALGIQSLLTFVLANSLILVLPLSSEGAIGVKVLVWFLLSVGVAAVGHGQWRRQQRAKSAIS